jgi:MFS transporter, MHS family, proline/betaine transporter
LVRPVGAIVIGACTDRAGSKAGLTLSILLMVIGTTMTALMPGYATIGLAAPILIPVARPVQGFSVGGEFGSAVTFLAEQTASRKGFVASWQWASTRITGFLASDLCSLFVAIPIFCGGSGFLDGGISKK